MTILKQELHSHIHKVYAAFAQFTDHVNFNQGYCLVASEESGSHSQKNLCYFFLGAIVYYEHLDLVRIFISFNNFR